jgi:hypothetical protein
LNKKYLEKIARGREEGRVIAVHVFAQMTKERAYRTIMVFLSKVNPFHSKRYYVKDNRILYQYGRKATVTFVLC